MHHKVITWISLLALSATQASCRVVSRATQTLTISTTGSYNSSPLLYGLMFEDINRSGDGGLYAELLKNRAFQGVTPGTTASLDGWSAISATIAVVADTPVSSALPNSLKVTIPSTASGAVGFANSGYWGMKIEAGKTYKASFYAKAAGSPGPVTVSLISSTGATLATQTTTSLSTSWKQYTVSLTPTASASNTANTFRITFNGATAKGQTAQFAMLSLFPPTWKGRENGMRADIAQPLADIKPSFFRFPGGNNLEGQTIPQFWNWTNTIGPLVNRPGRQGDWGYQNTDGLGLLEYLYWCEDANMVPIMGVYAGYSLDGTSVAQSALAPYVQHAINQIYFAIGDPATNKWAALRAQYGRTAPFNVQYIEVGNEDFIGNAPGTYASYRWKAFHDALLAEFPQLKIIATTAYSSPVLSPQPKYIDLHVYQTPTWFNANQELYKSRTAYPLSGPQIFEGEYAVTSTNSSCLYGAVSCGRLAFPTLRGSVAEATFMTGLERDSDLVFAAAYAPLLQNVDATQWTPDLISYNAGQVVLSTSYYIQKMFSVNRGDKILSLTASGTKNPVYWVASQNTVTKNVYVKLTNIAAAAYPIGFSFPNLAIGSSGVATILTNSNYDASNTLAAPSTVAPYETTFACGPTFEYTLPGNSAVVLKMTYT